MTFPSNDLSPRLFGFLWGVASNSGGALPAKLILLYCPHCVNIDITMGWVSLEELLQSLRPPLVSEQPWEKGTGV